MSKANMGDVAALPLFSEALRVQVWQDFSNPWAVIHGINGLLASVCAQDVIMCP